MHICILSVGIDELPKKQQRSQLAVARVLAKAGRFSVFEATANQTIAGTMDALTRSGWFVFSDAGYPWTKVTLTTAGMEALAAGRTLVTPKTETQATHENDEGNR